ncbi:hypothetical protein MMC10_002653 [Thelotrema lepadinum]|nr:hypothetical protein [Thelotrema lepadinum]
MADRNRFRSSHTRREQSQEPFPVPRDNVATHPPIANKRRAIDEVSSPIVNKRRAIGEVSPSSYVHGYGSTTSPQTPPAQMIGSPAHHPQSQGHRQHPAGLHSQFKSIDISRTAEHAMLSRSTNKVLSWLPTISSPGPDAQVPYDKPNLKWTSDVPRNASILQRSLYEPTHRSPNIVPRNAPILQRDMHEPTHQSHSLGRFFRESLPMPEKSAWNPPTPNILQFSSSKIDQMRKFQAGSQQSSLPLNVNLVVDGVDNNLEDRFDAVPAKTAFNLHQQSSPLSQYPPTRRRNVVRNIQPVSNQERRPTKRVRDVATQELPQRKVPQTSSNSPRASFVNSIGFYRLHGNETQFFGLPDNKKAGSGPYKIGDYGDVECEERYFDVDHGLGVETPIFREPLFGEKIPQSNDQGRNDVNLYESCSGVDLLVSKSHGTTQPDESQNTSFTSPPNTNLHFSAINPTSAYNAFDIDCTRGAKLASWNTQLRGHLRDRKETSDLSGTRGNQKTEPLPTNASSPFHPPSRRFSRSIQMDASKMFGTSTAPNAEDQEREERPSGVSSDLQSPIQRNEVVASRLPGIHNSGEIATTQVEPQHLGVATGMPTYGAMHFAGNEEGTGESAASIPACSQEFLLRSQPRNVSDLIGTGRSLLTPTANPSGYWSQIPKFHEALTASDNMSSSITDIASNSSLDIPKPCHTCRRSRVRCDRKSPSCGTCSKRGIECQYPPGKGIQRPRKEGTMKSTSSNSTKRSIARADDGPVPTVCGSNQSISQTQGPFAMRMEDTKQALAQIESLDAGTFYSLPPVPTQTSNLLPPMPVSVQGVPRVQTLQPRTATELQTPDLLPTVAIGVQEDVATVKRSQPHIVTDLQTPDLNLPAAMGVQEGIAPVQRSQPLTVTDFKTPNLYLPAAMGAQGIALPQSSQPHTVPDLQAPDLNLPATMGVHEGTAPVQSSQPHTVTQLQETDPNLQTGVPSAVSAPQHNVAPVQTPLPRDRSRRQQTNAFAPDQRQPTTYTFTGMGASVQYPPVDCVSLFQIQTRPAETSPPNPFVKFPDVDYGKGSSFNARGINFEISTEDLNFRRPHAGGAPGFLAQATEASQDGAAKKRRLSNVFLSNDYREGNGDPEFLDFLQTSDRAHNLDAQAKFEVEYGSQKFLKRKAEFGN